MRQRQGFTLVEMLVATALVIFIMVILTQAFVSGIDTFRQLKTIGDLEEKLRNATTILRKDLASDHFEGKKRLSDPNFWLNGPPREGFVRIWQGSASQDEGQDGDSVHSYSATNHALHLTVKRRGNRRDEYAAASVPAGSPLLTLGQTTSRFQDASNTYSSQWYEVVYFLNDSGDQTPGGVHRYTLYRRQRAVVPDNYAINWSSPVTVNNDSDVLAYAEVSCQRKNPGAAYPDQLYFNSPNDLTVPQRRYGGLTSTYSPLMDQNNVPVGSDVLLTDVISFSVRVLLAGANDFADLSMVANANSPFPAGAQVFDTWSSLKDDTYDYSGWNTGGNATSLPNSQTTQIKALQIIIRVWDVKTQLTRQITLVQDM
jgi:prepilin-type N-terminal cleavage/methylation domain-containing protein